MNSIHRLHEEMLGKDVESVSTKDCFAHATKCSLNVFCLNDSKDFVTGYLEDDVITFHSESRPDINKKIVNNVELLSEYENRNRLVRFKGVFCVLNDNDRGDKVRFTCGYRSDFERNSYLSIRHETHIRNKSKGDYSATLDAMRRALSE